MKKYLDIFTSEFDDISIPPTQDICKNFHHNNGDISVLGGLIP